MRQYSIACQRRCSEAISTVVAERVLLNISLADSAMKKFRKIHTAFLPVVLFLGTPVSTKPRDPYSAIRIAWLSGISTLTTPSLVTLAVDIVTSKCLCLLLLRTWLSKNTHTHHLHRVCSRISDPQIVPFNHGYRDNPDQRRRKIRKLSESPPMSVIPHRILIPACIVSV